MADTGFDPTRLGSADPGPFFHGTKVALRAGDLLEAGRSSNFGEGKTAAFVYLTATLDAVRGFQQLTMGEDEPSGALDQATLDKLVEECGA